MPIGRATSKRATMEAITPTMSLHNILRISATPSPSCCEDSVRCPYQHPNGSRWTGRNHRSTKGVIHMLVGDTALSPENRRQGG
uniref:Uncharacterized protein n=1 Tax=Anguilla anguilla TaxID=7936 RepID=A0A0E9XFF2_ANGAN